MSSEKTEKTETTQKTASSVSSTAPPVKVLAPGEGRGPGEGPRTVKPLAVVPPKSPAAAPAAPKPSMQRLVESAAKARQKTVAKKTAAKARKKTAAKASAQKPKHAARKATAAKKSATKKTPPKKTATPKKTTQKGAPRETKSGMRTFAFHVDNDLLARIHARVQAEGYKSAKAWAIDLINERCRAPLPKTSK